MASGCKGWTYPSRMSFSIIQSVITTMSHPVGSPAEIWGRMSVAKNSSLSLMSSL
jgi:hypothetical protein